MVTVGIVGFGALGQYLSKKVLESAEFELKFIWNRSVDKIDRTLIDSKYILHDLSLAPSTDLIIEVAHPDITRKYGETLLQRGNLIIGSPTVLADGELRDKLEKACKNENRIVFIPAGALWGGEDIKKMADLDSIRSLTITMAKHPTSFKLEYPLNEANDQVLTETVLYDGPVAELCPLAPNNVNTMAAAAIAAHTLGFEGVTGRLISNPCLEHRHVVTVELESKSGLKVKTTRDNPAKSGAVTGNATYASFWASLTNAAKKLPSLKNSPGINLC